MKSHETWWERNIDSHYDIFKNWLGGPDATSRKHLVSWADARGYKQALECGAGLCVDKQLFDTAGIEYQAIDITPKLVAMGRKNGVNIEEGSIESIPRADSSVELVYCRHVLEHLDGYQVALREMLRVARKEVCIIFFIPPKPEPEVISLDRGMDVYHNRYDTRLIEADLSGHTFKWRQVDERDVALHIIKDA